MTARHDRDGEHTTATLDPRIPEPIGAAVVIAAIAGVLSLGIHAPLAIPGAVLGIGLVVGMAGLTRSYWRIGLTTGLYVAIAGGSVGLVGVGVTGADPMAGVLALVAIVIGAGVGLLTVDGLTPQSVGRGGVAAMYGAVAATVWAAVVLAVETAGGVGAAVSELVWLGGTGSLGLRVSIVLAALAVAASAFAIPPAALTRPETFGRYRTIRRGAVVGLAIATVVLAGGASVSRYVPGMADVVGALAGSAVVRVPLAVTIATGTALAAVGAVVREIWSRASTQPNLAVPMLAGALLGVGGFVALAVSFGVATGEMLSVLVGTALVLGVGGSFAWAYGVERTDDARGAALSAAATIAVAIALGIGGIVTGAGVELERGFSVAAALEATAALTLFATAAFVTDVGKYGRILGWEVGRDGARPLPQFVRVGWSGAIAVAGFVVAALGFVAATLFAPVLSAPAMLAVVLGLGAVLLGSWLLFG
ncbi:putative membrane protein [Halorhabdus sp. SVX81]|uniref:hypothetical protein n=1 Tax=Halorhabdus sp. SVX81 TaxID=2978283 RepID=UPI0023DA2FFA|nr:hypothetical protein [Halorhabdus sp. SVX81]WEL18702.1 putative membrane protein [Halorhabdus sp. SVX81]